MSNEICSGTQSDQQMLTLGRKVLISESRALIKLSNELESSGFVDAVRLVLECIGHVIILGVGKSGHIGKKIAASLASTGTPSFFIHPAEAKHGDLGMITSRDLVILISYSGKSEEILSLLPYIYSIGAKTIALTNHSDSVLASKTNAHIALNIDREACPYNLAPTVSSSVTLGVGDAIAMTLMRIKQFTKEDFSRSHPAGSLGKLLTSKIRDVMVRGDKIPTLNPSASFLETISHMAAKRLGFVVAVDVMSRPVGVFMDADIPRVIKEKANFLDLKISDIMRTNLKYAAEDDLLIDCMKINSSVILIIDHAGSLLGAAHKQALST